MHGMGVKFLMVSQQNKLLQDNPSLESSFDTRRKYLDPLNHLQVLYYTEWFSDVIGFFTTCCNELLIIMITIDD